MHLVKAGGEQLKEEYLSLNPKGEVPYFIDGETKLSQSMAIIQYIDRKWPTRPLFPKKDKGFSECVMLCEAINSGIQPLQNLKVLKEIVNRFKISEEEKLNWAKFWMEEGFNSLEKSLKNFSKTYSMGEEISAVDLFLVPQVYNAKRFSVDLNKYPLISAIYENCLKLEAFVKADPENQPDSN